MSRKHIDIKVGETIKVGEATITLEKKSGQLARLLIVADENLPITQPTRMSASHFKKDTFHG